MRQVASTDQHLRIGEKAVPPTWEDFQRSAWWNALRECASSVLLLDYDGTLAPFVQERMIAIPYPGVKERLELLANSQGNRIAIISGRPIHELIQLLPAGVKAELWGSHGRERLNSDGKYIANPLTQNQQRELDDLERLLSNPGTLARFERKIGSIAVHTRGLSEAKAAQSRMTVERWFNSLPGSIGSIDLELLPFDGGVEVRATGYTKADAVDEVLRANPPDAVCAYLGDDMTDEDAFVAINTHRDSASILVRHEVRVSAAEWWLRPPDELLSFFDRYLEVVRERDGAS